MGFFYWLIMIFKIVTEENETIMFDAVASYTIDSTLELTSTPVQSGEVMTDHARLTPRKLKATVIVSDLCKRTEQHGEFGETRHINAYQTLQDIQKRKLLLTIYTDEEKLDNFMLTSLPRENSSDKHRTYKEDVEFTEVQFGIVKTGEVKPKNKSKHLTSKKKQVGKKPDAEPSLGELEKFYATRNNYSAPIRDAIVQNRTTFTKTNMSYL